MRKSLYKTFKLTLAALLLFGFWFAPRASAQDAAQSAPSQTDSGSAPDAQSYEHLPFMAETEKAGASETPSAFGLMARTLGALLLIVGLLVGGGWAARRFGGARFGASTKDAPALRVLSSVGLGDKRSLAVVSFGGRRLLIGSTAQAITLLATDDDADASSNELLDEGSSVPKARSVAELLNERGRESFEDELFGASERVAKADWRGDGSVA